MRKWLSLLVLLGFTLPAAAQPAYVANDLTCAGCHTSGALGAPIVDFDAYMNSGHPWKIHRTAGQVPAVDEWPHTPVPPLPTVDGVQLEWTDVEYVIGNFFWKARFIDRDGFIWTGVSGDATQWNLAVKEGQQGFVPYSAGTVNKPFDCGRCHTTGYERVVYDANDHTGDVDPNDPSIRYSHPDAGHQLDLPGLIGTWTQDGVRCEACHGPAGDHVLNPTVHPTGGKTCSECHYRDAEFRMPWKGGFTQHHQQGEDLSHSPHKNLADGCMACHDAHRSTVYDDGGVISECTDCHNPATSNGRTFEVNIPEMANISCTKCHMPKMGKSALAVNANKADVHGHLFRIMTDPIAAADNIVDGNGVPVVGNGYWKQDENGQSAATLDYACLGCHQGTEDTLQWAATYAANIHNMPPVVDAGGPYSGLVGQSVDFDASGTVDPDGDSLVFMWTFEGDAQPVFGATASHSWAAAGTYTATLSVTDGVNLPVIVDVTVDVTDAPPPPLTDTWLVKTPYAVLQDEFLVTFEEFAGILIVDTEAPDGTTSMGIGMEWDGVIYWMDMSYSIYFGNINRDAGTMSGVAFFDEGVSIFFGQRAP